MKQVEIAESFDANPHSRYTYWRRGKRFMHVKVIHDYRPKIGAVRIEVGRPGNEWVVTADELGPKPQTKTEALKEKSKAKRRDIARRIMDVAPECRISVEDLAAKVNINPLYVGRVITIEKLPLLKAKIAGKLYYERFPQDHNPRPNPLQEAQESLPQS